MPERFSQEYIDFVSRSEPIQAAWQKRGVQVGDWAIVHSEDMPHMITYVMAGSQYFYVYEDQACWKKTNNLPWKRDEVPWKGTVMYPFSYSRWLPTLSDLLAMIVEAVKEKEWGEWPHGPAEIILGFDWGSKDWYADVMGGHASALVADKSQEEFFDPELAAARLLERVLAGKEETDE